MTVKQVVIVGGGTAGWISAAVLARILGNVINITLVESDEIGTIGVGEATIPPILNLNLALKVDEGEFLRETQGTIKLGIEFADWFRQGESYMHAFGLVGKDYPFCDFHHVWTRYRQFQPDTWFWDFSLNYQAAKQNKFAHLDRIPDTPLPGLVYAYHFDAGLYARYLRHYAEARRVQRVEGKVTGARLCPESGFIQSVRLENGQTIDGDLFLDCSGFRGLLIDQQLQVGYEDWTHWLPCNRAVAMQTESVQEPSPYTRAMAHDAGWRWQIPLQHRLGNGLVYSDTHLSEDEASDRLLKSVAGLPMTEPRPLQFRTGRRLQQWHKNCVAIGLASGFLEPLESTSIHLIQTAIIRLVKQFPHQGIKQVDQDEYNRLSQEEFEHIRDFIIMHYHQNQRDDSEFWRSCAAMNIPDSLHEKIQLFRETGKVNNPTESLFSNIAWQQVLIGQGVIPKDYHPLATTLDEKELEQLAINLKSVIAKTLQALPSHQQWLAAACQQGAVHAKN